MKSISLPKSLGDCSIDTNNVKENATMTEICEKIHQVFQNLGWAIPVCSTFQYNARQKQLLYKYFIEVEGTGTKMSHQQVEQSLLSKLTVEEYVTVRQIKPL